jgi:citrate lyase subunit beta/citryl-CoA lyase
VAGDGSGPPATASGPIARCFVRLRAVGQERRASYRLRSLLFCPGNRSEMLAKLGAIGADAVAVDLEDGVPAEAKAEARSTARAGVEGLVASRQAVFVRVNGTDSPWIEDDISQALAPGVDGIILPKLESVDQLDWAASHLNRNGHPEAVIIGGLETAAGIEHAPHLHHDRLIAVYFGAEDYIADVGGERTESGHEVTYARARTVAAARIVGVAALDQVVVEVRNVDRFRREAIEGRQLGYSGKLCLHPAQVLSANEAFSPSETEIDRARRLLAAAEEASRAGRGVILFEGQMVDVPVIRHAERVLYRAGIRHEGSFES